MKPEEIKKIIKTEYEKIAITPLKTCSCKNIKLAQSIGYSKEDIENAPEANLGLGCGNPLSFVELKERNVVLDLGSGAGFDAFLASKKVGENGKVIGIDMTPEMINRAKENSLKYNYENVEFLLGDIENLPIENNSIDVVISNCVINLAPNKNKVFEECYRVLKENGKMYVSDIVLLENLSKEQKENKKLISGCVAGALLREEYIKIIENAGFVVNILNEDKQISKEQYKGVNLESLKVEAIKKEK